MIGLGLILLIVGVILIVASSAISSHPIPAVLGQVGWLLAMVGVVLIVVGALDRSNTLETSLLVGGGLAMAVPLPGGGFGAPDDDGMRTGPPPTRQPVLLGFLVGAIPLFAAALAALAEIFTGMPDWIVPTFTVLGTLTTGLAALWSKQRVTPTSDPRLDDGTRLVPEVQ